MMRIATDRDAMGESPFRDIGGYAVLGAERVERTRKTLEREMQLREASSAPDRRA
jgi:hypothetical protein